MQKKLKKLASRNELYIFLIIVALALLIQVRSG